MREQERKLARNRVEPKEELPRRSAAMDLAAEPQWSDEDEREWGPGAGTDRG